jgi:general secretion pathway protein C
MLIVAAFGFAAAKIAGMFLPHPLPKAPSPKQSLQRGRYVDVGFVCEGGERKKAHLAARSINGVRLAGIYRNADGGFVALAKDGGMEFVSLGKEYRGYRLKKIGDEWALFEKEGQKVVLVIEEDPAAGMGGDDQLSDERESGVEQITIPRQTVDRLRRDPSVLMRQIGLKPVRYGGSRAYEVIYMAPGTIFERLGIKKGDIIISIDGENLDNPMVLTKIFDGDLESLRVKIVRNHSVKEIEYAIE